MGTFNVWVKRVGNNPKIKVLLLHGGPGATHEYFETFDSFLPKADVEYYYYDQLDAGNSDRPGKPELWDLARYVDEVEQVRQALKLDKSNFYLLGHSWGGMLAMEYALAHQDQLKGLIISNMMSSSVAYNKYAHDVLMPKMDPKVLAEVQKLEAAKRTDSPRYTELLFPTYYAEHLLRRPPDRAHKRWVPSHSYAACIDERRRKSVEPWRSHDGAPKPSIDRPIRRASAPASCCVAVREPIECMHADETE